MKVPQGIFNPYNKICKIIKFIYGLKQASSEWFSKLLAELLLKGFVQSKNNYNLFIKNSEGLITIIIVYIVDGIILSGTDMTEIDALKAHFSSGICY